MEISDNQIAIKIIHKALNKLLKQDEEQAKAVVESGLLDILNEPFKQGFGPLVAHTITPTLYDVPQESRLDEIMLFWGGELSDEELEEYKKNEHRLVKV